MKFIKVSVTRRQFTDVYLEVPDDFGYPIPQHMLEQACDEVTGEEWDSDVDDIECERVADVTESEARKYAILPWDEVRPEPKTIVLPGLGT